MSGIYRRVKPKLKLGAEGKKNREKLSRRYENIEKGVLIIDKQEAGYGYKHLLGKKEILEFIEIIPEWEKLSEGLNIILLAKGSNYSDGWHSRGKISIRAWEKDLWREVSLKYFNEHKMIFDKLNVRYENKKHKYSNQSKRDELRKRFQRGAKNKESQNLQVLSWLVSKKNWFLMIF